MSGGKDIRSNCFFLFFFYRKQQQHQPSNIILIRGARTENGQIILQNGHDLLSLLNSGAVSISSGDDDNKITCNTSSSPSILLHRTKTSFVNTVAPTQKHTSNETNKFVIQSALKNANINSNQIIDANSLSSTLTGNGIKGKTLLHSSQALKNASTSIASTATVLTSVAAATTVTAGGGGGGGGNATTANTIPEGSIILQQRLNKNGTNDRPILLQTLKRIDKSPSILLFRNSQATGTTTCTLTTASPNIVKTTSVGNHITVLSGNKDDDKTDSRLKTKTISSNVPLGAGKYQPNIHKYIQITFYTLCVHHTHNAPLRSAQAIAPFELDKMRWMSSSEWRSSFHRIHCKVVHCRKMKENPDNYGNIV